MVKKILPSGTAGRRTGSLSIGRCTASGCDSCRGRARWSSPVLGPRMSVRFHCHQCSYQQHPVLSSLLCPHVFLPGQYMCFAENAHGVATSNSVFVRQSYLNNFKELPPITKTVEEGKPFTLPCKAPDGRPKPSVNWMIQVTC